MNYVVHYCKNKNCNNAWIDEDLTKVTTRPPQWKYCKECQAKGFVNPLRPILTEQQAKNILKNKYNKQL